MKRKLLSFLIIGLLFTNYLISQNNHFENAEKNYKKSVEFESKNIDSSFTYIKKAYAILKAKDTINSNFADILNQYGRIWYHKKDYKKAYNFFQRCFHTTQSIGEISNSYKVKVNMAVCQRKLNNTEKALNDFFDIVKFYEENDKSNINLGITYSQIADLYLLNKQHQFAENYYLKTEPFFKNKKTFALQMQCNRISNFNNYDLKKSVEIINELESTTDLDSLPVFLKAPLFNNIGQTMVKIKNYEKALPYTLKALKIKKEKGLKIDISNQYNNLGEIYINTKNYTKAIKYLDSAKQNASTNQQKFKILENLQKAHKKTNNLEKSLEYANMYIALKDSLNEVLTQKEIVELGVKYETKEKDRFIDKLENLSIVYKVLILFILIFGVFISRNLFLKNKTIKTEFDLLQEELNIFKEEKSKKKQITNNEIIHLKSKAILNSTDILYVKSDGHYVEYFTDNKTNPEIDRNSLNEVLKILPSSSFIRIHKSFIVNIYRIKIINSTKVMLDNGVWINLSRTYKQQLKAILHKDD